MPCSMTLHCLLADCRVAAVLCSCVKALQARGMKVLGDAVLNHRCAHYQGAGGIWNQFGGKMSWDERAIVGAWPSCGAVC